MPGPVQYLPEADFRVDTGVLQIGEDWPGYFIRGDFAIPLAALIARFLDGHPGQDAIAIHRDVQRLVDLAAGMASAHNSLPHAQHYARMVQTAGTGYMRRLQDEGKL